MRLINTSTWELKEYIGGSNGGYAILSHTWGKEEITFQDMVKISTPLEIENGVPKPRDNYTSLCMAKAGYHKICKAAEVAASLGYGYIWIDTCCIDRTSSAELRKPSTP